MPIRVLMYRFLLLGSRKVKTFKYWDGSGLSPCLLILLDLIFVFSLLCEMGSFSFHGKIC